MLSHHIQRNMVMGNVNPKSIDKKCITVRDKLNSLYCCPTQILWREKKDHSAYQVTEQVKSRELLKERVREGLGLFCCFFFLWHLLAWSSQHLGRALSPLSANTLLCVIHQPAVFHLPAPVQHRPGEGPVVGARYDSLDILFKVLERLVPPDPCKEVGLGSFFQHLLVGHCVIPPEKSCSDVVSHHHVHSVVVMSKEDAEHPNHAECPAKPVIPPESPWGILFDK